jgi:hypothetical protein
LIATARDLGVPLRHESPVVRHCGSFYGQSARGEPYPAGISVDGLIATVRGLDVGYTELGCHPGWADDLDSAYSRERAVEVRTLCDPRVRAALVELGIKLGSFRDVPLNSPPS